MTKVDSIEDLSGDFPAGVAVVFGGSGGIGQGICLALGERGCNVALTYRRNVEAAHLTVKKLMAMGRAAEAVQIELNDIDAVAQALSALNKRYGRIHTIVFATGADISMTYVSNIDPQEWRRTIEGDLHGFFHVVKGALPLLREGGGGSLLAITSAGIDRHPPLDILSVVPKAGIEALMRGIGMIDGGLFHRIEKQVQPEVINAMRRNTALKRFGSVEDVANVVVFLASKKAAYVTGQHIAVDGGFSV